MRKHIRVELQQILGAGIPVKGIPQAITAAEHTKRLDQRRINQILTVLLEREEERDDEKGSL